MHKDAYRVSLSHHMGTLYIFEDTCVMHGGLMCIGFCLSPVCLSVWVCETCAVHHFVGKGLHCAPTICIVPYRPALYTMVNKGDLCPWEGGSPSIFFVFFLWFTWNMHKMNTFCPYLVGHKNIQRTLFQELAPPTWCTVHRLIPAFWLDDTCMFVVRHHELFFCGGTKILVGCSRALFPGRLTTNIHRLCTMARMHGIVFLWMTTNMQIKVHNIVLYRCTLLVVHYIALSALRSNFVNNINFVKSLKITTIQTYFDWCHILLWSLLTFSCSTATSKSWFLLHQHPAS